MEKRGDIKWQLKEKQLEDLLQVLEERESKEKV